MRYSDCRDCMLAEHCAFPLLFMGKTSENGRMLPPPYCLVPSDTGRIFYGEGENFSFGLTLFSYAVEYLPYFAHAFILAGQHGMGKKMEQVRGTFDVEHIFHENRPLFHKEAQRLDIPSAQRLSLPSWQPVPEAEGDLIVHLNTPCRFKSENHLSETLPFRQLLQLIVRRIRTLWMLDGERVILPELPAMLDEANAVQNVETRLFWKDWTRYSSRQNVSMQLGGIQGSVRYRGRLAAFLPFLALAQELNIGKQISFGLGQMSFTWIPKQ